MGLDTLVFDFTDLPLWDMTTAGEATQNPTMIEVDLCSMPPEAVSTTLTPTHVFTSTTQPTITKILNLHIQGAFEQVQQTSSTTSMPVSQHSAPRRKLPSMALGAPTPHWSRRSTQTGGSRLSHAQANVFPSQMPQCMVMPSDNHVSLPISHSPSLPPVLKSLTVASVAFTPWSETCFRADLGALYEEVLKLQGEMNMTMGGLLTTRASWTPTKESWCLILKLPLRRPRPSAQW